MNNIKEDIYSKYISELNDLKESDSFRSFITHAERDKKYIYINGKKYLNLSSNDYLGLSSDRELINEFYSKMKCGKGFHQEFMLGSSSSRSLTADSVIHNELETELSQLYHNEVLLFNSGYHANIGIIPAVTTREDLILTDKLNHASIIDGSRLSFAKCLKYDHLNYENLEDFLKRHRDRYKNVIIVSESLFSMNGDIADIKKLVELKQKYNCLLYIDEAHSAGVFGTDGLGICKENDIIKEIDFVVVTFGKAFGSYGAFV
ncbi:MAG: pyridoxal phosphate-dependent aminotransferase family protein, partial [Candidatus Delongbacteria bacterium]|nr:pyridoxal phosphate-dependent aminotransferase family protein [Candidatus Delongbacteria bacterium]